MQLITNNSSLILKESVLYGHLLILSLLIAITVYNSLNFKIRNHMKKENWKTIINFLITVLTAIASAFCVQSCKS